MFARELLAARTPGLPGGAASALPRPAGNAGDGFFGGGEVRRAERGGGWPAKRGGFTLIELLVVTAILGLVIGVIGAAVGAGLRVWDRAGAFQRREAEAAVALQILEKDLINTFAFADIPFRGEPRELLLAGYLAAESGPEAAASEPETADDPAAVVRPIALIRYAVDPSRGELLRQAWRQAPGGAKLGEGRPERLAAGVKDGAFSFYGAPSRSGGASAWQETWHSATSLPQAVRIRLHGEDEDGEPFAIEKTVLVPVGLGQAGQERPR